MNTNANTAALAAGNSDEVYLSEPFANEHYLYYTHDRDPFPRRPRPPHQQDSMATQPQTTNNTASDGGATNQDEAGSPPAPAPAPALAPTYGKHRAPVVPVLPIPDPTLPNDTFFAQIRTLHSLLQTNASLAIPTGHETLLDTPLENFPSTLAKFHMDDLQLSQYELWASSNGTYLPPSVRQCTRFYPPYSNLPMGNRVYSRDDYHLLARSNTHLVKPLQYIFQNPDGSLQAIHPETITFVLAEGRADLLPLAQAILKVLRHKGKIQGFRSRRGGKWPSPEELAELVVLEKIMGVIEKKIERISVWGREHYFSCGGCRHLVWFLGVMKGEFDRRVQAVWRGEWFVRGYHRHGEVRGNWSD